MTISRAFRLVRIEAFACRHPLKTPVATSFGTLRDRPAVFVRVEDEHGAFGWGEAFANWPVAGAEHRVNLLMDDVAALVFGPNPWADPVTLFRALESRTRIRALQCGEPGPFHQVIAALDIAAWDLVSRRAGCPLFRLLADEGSGMSMSASVGAYASGIHIDAAPEILPRARAEGFTAFKLKVGFDRTSEPDKVHAAADWLTDEERLFADANQAWDVAGTEAFLGDCADAGLGWMEEPIPVDSPDADWQRLARQPVPLAGGENLAGAWNFEAACRLGALRIVQPDVAKWGGVSGCLSVARRVRASGGLYCPHFLGGGIGLSASTHVLAAAGGEGLLEVDVNPNPLREAFATDVGRMSGGRWQLGEAPGLGIDRLPDALARTITLQREVRGA